MPLFQYHCEKCTEDHEILVRGSEEPACPSCGSKRLTKLASAFAAVTAAAGSDGPSPACGSCCQRGDGSCPYS
jgi:putative FmdB family regulatory protein